MSTLGVPLGTAVDGSFYYSSEDITISLVIPPATAATPVTFFSKTIRFSDTGKRITGENSASVVIRKAYVKPGYLTGTMDLMYPSVAEAVYPPSLTPFTMTVPEISSTALNCIVVTSGPSRNNDGEAVCSVEFDTLIGTLTVGN